MTSGHQVETAPDRTRLREELVQTAHDLHDHVLLAHARGHFPQPAVECVRRLSALAAELLDRVEELERRAGQLRESNPCHPPP